MFQKFQAAFKGLRQEIVFRVNEITFTGFDDPVDRSVGQTESGIRFLLLKENNITMTSMISEKNSTTLILAPYQQTSRSFTIPFPR